MKRYFIKSVLPILTVLAVIATSCTDDFTNRPPEDGISLDDYYATNDQVASATSGMYARTWFQFNNKFFYAVTEIGSGNMYSGSSDVSAMNNFSLNGSDPELQNGWASLWANVGQANAIINFLTDRVSGAVDDDVLQNTIGEAYFMRATAYFYLVRLWGDVPIIENNLDFVSTPSFPKNRIEDVYKLIKMDYNAAIERLYTNPAQLGRVSKNTAKAMLAKVHLYLKEYAEARAMAEEVINSGQYHLLGGPEAPDMSYADLYKFPNNNNAESIFALQWVTDGNYGSANNCNTQFGISTGYVTTSNASYGGVFGPSQDVLDLYEPSDRRRKPTLMLPGDEYPEVKVLIDLNGDGTKTPQVGFTVPSAEEIGGQGAGAAIKKYCIGIVNGNQTGPIDAWAMMENNTYIMRYAELLLIHAEAVLGNSGSTSEAAALNSFNAVRNRAGLASVSSITFDDIFLERRKELCFEGDFWFDLGRIPREEAIAFITAQNRGNMFTEQHFTPDVSDFYLDYPDNDVAKNPLLLEPPVPYEFNE